ncbi:MAG: RnfABCDGE type electron transport complex subunit D [Candidatus Omnitrophota bacterium]
MNKLVVSASPHIRTQESVRSIMWAVVLALVPAGAVGVWVFGLRALGVIGVSLASALFFEAAVQRLRGQKITLSDGSAFLTGLLLSYNLPSNVPLWLPVAGSFVAIVIAKQAFGGLGRNIFNPALVGRAFLLASWPGHMTTFSAPFDILTRATPLAMLKEGHVADLAAMKVSYFDLLFGLRGGCIGEVCVVALLLGALFLWWRKIISCYAPLVFISVVAGLSWAFAGPQAFSGDAIFAALSGGLVLGAFFMATDYVTTPLTAKGQAIFGLGCGLLTFVIRQWGGYPEGVSYSILMMNAAVPLIDRWVN